jgi:hypothetical protein
MAVGFWKYCRRLDHVMNWCIYVVFAITLGLKARFWLQSFEYINGDGTGDNVAANVSFPAGVYAACLSD